MATFDGLPETAAPFPGAFETAFRSLAGAGRRRRGLHQPLLGAVGHHGRSAQNGAKAVADAVEVHVVDSKSITSGLGTLVTIAAEAAAGGASAEEVVALVERTRERSRVIGGLDTLENLKKGGRIGGAQAMLGTLLSIKPVIDISTGVVEEAGKVRTRKKQMQFVRDLLTADGGFEHLVIADGDAPDAEEFVTLMSEIVPEGSFTRATIGPVIGTHGGPRIIGLTWLTKDPEA